jgi:hypothetical protein
MQLISLLTSFFNGIPSAADEAFPYDWLSQARGL